MYLQMNIKNKSSIFGIVTIFLVANFLFIQFLQVSAQEENFIDYKTQYNFENVEELQGQNVQPQQDLETGILTLKGWRSLELHDPRKKYEKEAAELLSKI